MNKHTIHRWEDIEKDFAHNLLLGNGGSIAIDKRFSYKLLYEKVSQFSELNKELLGLFQHYNTTNFELILRLLLETSKINKILNIEENKTEQYYVELRNALIQTIRSIHPQYEEVKSFFNSITNFLKRFKKVLSLNYDLLVYWSMLAYNEKAGQWFKDCFVYGKFEKDFKYLAGPLPPAEGATLVFYPHGSLFLATEPFGGEVKVSSTSDDYLLDSVLSRWEQEDYIPLFVSEGATHEKLKTITRNNYLNTVYDSVLARLTDSLVIYGWSLSDQDKHILDAIARGELERIAISVHMESKNWESYCNRVLMKIGKQPRLRRCKIYFFDSNSKGCWIC